VRVKVVFGREEVGDKLAPMLERIDTVLNGEWLLGETLESGCLVVEEIDVMTLEFKAIFVMPLNGKLVRGNVTFGGLLVGDAPGLRFELIDTMPDGACLLKECTETGELKVERTAMVRLNGTRLALGAPVPVPGGGIGERKALPEALGNRPGLVCREVLVRSDPL
jgi:hypothetical protein